jgi:hypothetical protein
MIRVQGGGSQGCILSHNTIKISVTSEYKTRLVGFPEGLGYSRPLWFLPLKHEASWIITFHCA